MVNSTKKLNFISIDNIKVVDLRSAKYLKKCGFNKPTYWYWLDKDLPFVKRGLKRIKQNYRRMNHNKYDDFIYSAPTEEDLQYLKKRKTI